MEQPDIKLSSQRFARLLAKFNDKELHNHVSSRLPRHGYVAFNGFDAVILCIGRVVDPIGDSLLATPALAVVAGIHKLSRGSP